jgi:hypothetical protein
VNCKRILMGADSNIAAKIARGGFMKKRFPIDNTLIMAGVHLFVSW